MNIYIYDIEVFADDWIVVFRRPEENSDHIVIHNDNNHLRSFLSQPNIILGGFNNKHYDNWILLTMYLGGSNIEVKRHNDYIINGSNAWEFPFVSYKKLPVPTFDLRDDIADIGISLKSIEGNLGLPIVESSVSFDIDRKLTSDELEEVIKYCKYDVDSTIRLYHERLDDYINAKILVGEMYDLSPQEAVGLTNAKLSAKVLGAKLVKRTDEREYVIPDNIDANDIPQEVLNFFNLIHDKSIPDAKLFGSQGSKGMTLDVKFTTSYGTCPVTYAWGGVHGAKPCITVEEDEERVIINQDVASLYPSSMINFGYCSRSMADAKAYESLVKRRLEYKRNGEKKQAGALKLVVNTVYGAMLNKYNDLADRWAGRSVCISNQLAMTMLIVRLARACETIDFININTDGIMFSIARKEVDTSEQIVNEWCKVTKFEMERDDFTKVIQKDVNNYIGIKADGSIKTKGGFVSLYKGGNFKTNSLSIVHKAIVEFLVNGIPTRDTISNCKDMLKFQQVVKTGGTFDGTYHYINSEKYEVQKVNRVYAVKDPTYGQIVKGKLVKFKRKKNKETGKMDEIPVDPPKWQEEIISECPTHAYIDNTNKLTVDKLDLEYYINMANSRIDKYINIDRKVKNKLDKIKKEIVIMATAKATSKNVFEKLLLAREQFLNAGLKKTGINRYAEYKYFTLDEIIPIKQKIFKELGLSDIISFTDSEAVLQIFNTDNTDEVIVFSSQLAPDESMIKNPIQKVGAVQTYIRRYLYVLALDIIESDGIEETTGKPVDEDGKPAKNTAKKSNRPATNEEREEVKEELTDQDGEFTKTQKTAITNGLKKLRTKYMDKDNKVFDDDLEKKYSKYISATVKKVKQGLTKSEADALLIEIGEKVAE